ncbi:MAG TPA: GAF domain-containing protein [Polyangiaceae bacterium]
MEVTPIGKSDTQKYTVDAESWQKALQSARAMRKEDGSISGFSIELADDGYRAVDPTARLRYMVKKAPADAALTTESKAPPPVAPVAAPAAPVAVSPSNAPPKQSISVPPPRAEDASKAAKQTIAFGSSGAALLASSPAATNAPAPAPSVPRAAPSRPSGSQPAASKAPKAPESVRPLAAAPSNHPPPVAPLVTPSNHPPPVHAQPAPAQSPAATMKPVSVPPPAQVNTTESQPPPSGRQGPPIVVLFKKAQEPTEKQPLSYREEVFAAPPGTSEERAEQILRAHFHLVMLQLASAPKNKYVNFAVFDRVFEGRPPSPPLATLSWRDWKDAEPVVTFPRRAKEKLTTATQPSNLGAAAAHATGSHPIAPAAAAPAPVAPSQHPPPQYPSRAARLQEPPPSDAARAVSAAPPPSRAHVEMVAEKVVVADETPLPIANDVPSEPATTPMLAPDPAPSAASMEPVASFAPSPSFAPQPVAQPAPVPVPAPAPAQAPASKPLADVVAAPHFPEPATNGNVPTPAPSAASATGQFRRARKPTPSAPDGTRIRVRGDELIALLFEEMHDLHFMADALEGAAFCLWVIQDKLPSKAAFVHFYDLNAREFVVASVVGEGQEQITKRNSQSDPFLAEAMRRRGAYVVKDAATHEGANGERFQSFGGAKSLVIAPVMLGGRALGAIEIVNPIDGNPFGEDDGNAIAYLAEQFAEFVSSHGLVTDEGRIRKASMRPPA